MHNGHMRTKRRLLLLGLVAAVVLGVAFIWPGSPGTPYTGGSAVHIRPYTNAVFTGSFQAAMVQKNPGLVRLLVFPIFDASHNKCGAVIGIITRGTNSVAAEWLAEQAATNISDSVQQLYQVTARVNKQANQARPYSFYRDTFTPEAVRLLSRD